MRKSFYLSCLAMLMLPGTLAFGQQRTTNSGIPSANEPSSGIPLAPVNQTNISRPPLPWAGGPGCTGVDSLSTSSNIFTNILTEANPIAYDHETNSIVFVHRNNATAFGGHSGQLRYDLSTNGGQSWTSNVGPLNPASVNGTNGARYPNVAIYNPPGNTNPSNAYLSYISATVATTWNGAVTGVRQLSGTGNTETYNQSGATQTLIPRGMTKGAPGVMWAIDGVFNGTNVIGFRVLKGTWNGTNDFVWAVNTTLTPTWNTTLDGNPKNSDFNIAFDPTGQKGWISFLGHISTGGAGYAMYPIFYNTTDGGSTWSGPTQVDISQFPCVSSNITAGNVAALAFDMDLTVDVNGNPHALVTACNGDNAYAVFFGSWHAMMDITLDHGVWNAVHINNVFRGRGTWGVAPNTVTQDMEAQVSRSADGTKLFFFWTDNDSINVNANQQPNLRGKAYDVLTRTWTPMTEFTECHPTFNGKAMFPKVAAHAMSISNGHEVPIVIARFLSPANDPLAVASFQYLDSIAFLQNEYTIPQCVLPVSISATDTIFTCVPITLNAGTGNAFKWNTGATTSTISVSSSGWYSVGVNSSCCVGWDSVYVVYSQAPTAIFGVQSNGLSYTFNDLSIGNPTSYAWDFGDGNTSTLASPMHTFAAAGTYNVCLTITNACSTSTACQSIIVTCPAPVATYTASGSGLSYSFTNTSSGTPTSITWDFGDGNTSTSANPSHTYAAAGTYQVCLTIVDACGQDSVCQSFVVCEAPVSAYVVTAGTGPIFGFMDQSTGNPTSWLWDFGDGNTSTQQNPSHTYASSGLYVVCLSAINSCDTSTFCDTINSVIGGLYGELDHMFQLIPNPAVNEVRLSAEGLDAGEYTVSIVNVLGQELANVSANHQGGQFMLNLTVDKLPRGLYMVRIGFEDGRQAVRQMLLN